MALPFADTDENCASTHSRVAALDVTSSKEKIVANPFVHVELNTPDPEKAKVFYSKLFQWQLEDVPNPAAALFAAGANGEGEPVVEGAAEAPADEVFENDGREAVAEVRAPPDGPPPEVTPLLISANNSSIGASRRALIKRSSPISKCTRASGFRLKSSSVCNKI